MSREALTMDLPCAQDAARHDAAEPVAFTGIRIGPLFCHHAISDDESTLMGDFGEADFGDWNITHIATGYAVIKGAPTAFRAIWLAERLLELTSMEGNSVEDIRQSVAGLRPQIDALRMDAKNGDCQGACIGVVPQFAREASA